MRTKKAKPDETNAPKEQKTEPPLEPIPEPTAPPAPAQEPRPIAIVDMGNWSARVFADGRVERYGRPGEDVEPTKIAEALRRVVAAQHKALCPTGTGTWTGNETIVMVNPVHAEAADEKEVRLVLRGAASDMGIDPDTHPADVARELAKMLPRSKTDPTAQS
jgi:hypothetical protein